ncbi:Lrp/AsnC family transcriptional regulator [Candidatus Woesearchaeota archaeon]|nr:Lrp/AsnC family transcriptional regulator [Candidatus Woesearchaeota archaeon]
MIKLDRKDWKLLAELDVDSRQTYQSLAKKVGLSKDAVVYRIVRLQKEGVIQQFHTVIDVGKIGYISFRLYIALLNGTPEKEIEILKYFKQKKEVAWLVSIDGEYSIGMWILVKDIAEMNSLWKEFLEKYHNYVEKRSLSIFTKVSYFPRSYLLGKEKTDAEYIFITEPTMGGSDDVPDAVDEKDIAILQLLTSDARKSVVDISQKTGMTPKTVAVRIKNMEKKNVIVGYRTLFDLEKIGYQYFKLHINLQNAERKDIQRFRTYVKQHPNIIYDNEVLGGDDLEIEIQVKNLEHFRGIISEIKKQFAPIMRNYKHMTFYKEHKSVFLPL